MNSLDRIVFFKNGKTCIETAYLDPVTNKWTVEHTLKHKVIGDT